MSQPYGWSPAAIKQVDRTSAQLVQMVTANVSEPAMRKATASIRAVLEQHLDAIGPALAASHAIRPEGLIDPQTLDMLRQIGQMSASQMVDPKITDTARRVGEMVRRDLMGVSGAGNLTDQQLSALVEAAKGIDRVHAHAVLAEQQPDVAAAVDDRAIVSDLRAVLDPEEVRWFLAALVFVLVVWARFAIGQHAPGEYPPDVGAHLYEGIAAGLPASLYAKRITDKFVNRPPDRM